MPRTIEQQIKDLLDRVNLLEGIVIEGKQPPTPGSEEYFNVVIPALAKGDVKPLIAFKKRGGVVPDYEPLPNEARRTCIYKPRKRVERPRAEPTNGCGTPVMLLPGRDKAAKEQRRVV